MKIQEVKEFNNRFVHVWTVGGHQFSGALKTSQDIVRVNDFIIDADHIVAIGPVQ